MNFNREVLKLVKIIIKKCWGYDNVLNNIIKRLSVLTMSALKYCILRSSFSEMLDSLARIIGLGGLRTRARTDGRTHGIKVSELQYFQYV